MNNKINPDQIKRNEEEKLSSAISKSIKTASNELGHVTLLVVGKTGVGKSTLINAVFSGDLSRP